MNRRSWRRVACLLTGLCVAMSAPGAGKTIQGQTGTPPASVEAATSDFVPVLVVPGWFDTGAALAGLRVRLRSAGWPSLYIAAVTFADPTGGNERHAEEIGTAVGYLLARTGAERVDIIAHSMGGLATRRYLLDHPEKVRRVVFLASPHRGTLSAYLAFGEGREEMLPESDFLKMLNHAPPVPHNVEAITVRTLIDTHIVPGSSATLPGVPDFTVCCATHEGLTRDLDAFRHIQAFLRRDGGPT